MAEMVWCQSCNTVVWAYDHQPKVDLRGICNMLKLPCPKCGDTGNFDGWASNSPMEQLKEIPQICDAWSGMRYIAATYDLKWETSPDCSWFRRPDESTEEYEEKIHCLRLHLT